MSAPSTTQITLTWTGKTWKAGCLADPKLLRKGASFKVPVPQAAFKQQKEGARTRLLFPKGTVLYLPLKPAKDERTLWQCNAATPKPKLAKSPDKDLLPIVLGEDLHVRISSRILCDCVCHFAGRDREQYDSLHAAAKMALKTWTNQQKAAINVFDRVQFVHDSELILLDRQRDLVLSGIPLPVSNVMNQGPTLPGM